MPRALRPPIENGLYHVTARGNRKEDIYFDVADRQYFLQLAGRIVERCGWIVHAYCLMTNHYHLVVATPATNLSYGMQRLNSMYASWINWRYDLCGHLFGDRFDSKFIETDAHLLQACRYVVLNPVRAGICDDAGEYRWSSYRATLGTEPRPCFLTVDAVLDSFGGGRDTAPNLYRAFVDAGAAEAIRLRRRPTTRRLSTAA